MRPLLLNGTSEELLTALSFDQQFPTKTHFSPLPNTIDKKKERCKLFYVIFPLQDNDLADFCNVNFIINNQLDMKLIESNL